MMTRTLALSVGACLATAAAGAADRPVGTATLAALLTPVTAPPPPVKKDLLWLPLGDSITWGCGTDAKPRGGAACCPTCGGYRVPLAWSLSEAGYNVSTMGTLVTGPEYVPNQWIHHEGHPGWRFDQIDAILDKSLTTSAQPPELITIHLGTNDCGQKLTVPTIKANADKLLTHIFAKVPAATVYMASMIGFPHVPVCSGPSSHICRLRAAAALNRSI